MGWYASLTVVGHRRLVSLSTRTPNVILQGMREATRGVRGFLVRFPLHFLHAEHLGPGLVVGSLLGTRMFQ